MMRFYTGSRFNHQVAYGYKDLEEKLIDVSYRYRICDYTTISNKKELKDMYIVKADEMFVCDDEIWVSTGEPFEWYRYKYLKDTGEILQRIKIENHDDSSVDSIRYRVNYIIKPSHKKRKELKARGENYLLDSEKFDIIIIVAAIASMIFTIII